MEFVINFFNEAAEIYSKFNFSAPFLFFMMGYAIGAVLVIRSYYAKYAKMEMGGLVKTLPRPFLTLGVSIVIAASFLIYPEILQMLSILSLVSINIAGFLLGVVSAILLRLSYKNATYDKSY